jgi:hypothetical protein
MRLTTLKNQLRSALLLASVVVVSACGGGAETESNPIPQVAPTQQAYSGPTSQTDDIQAYRLNVWENLRTDERCSRCHVNGSQAPFFMRDDNINLAYAAALPLVNRNAPFESRLVTKVGSGHNCWLESNVACADVMLRWVENWVNAGGDSAGRQIPIAPLSASALREREPKIQFPASFTEYENSKLYSDVKLWCSDCHSSDADSPRKPYFADTQSAEVAYSEVIAKLNLESPEQSRLVERPRDEGHGCAAQNCATYASTIEVDIQLFADSLGPAVFDPDLVASKAVVIANDGIIAAGGSRYENDMIALYEFKAGDGFIADDTSGIDPPANLVLSDNSMWMSNWGLEFEGGKAQATVEDSRKIADLIKATGEYTIETWVVPGNVTQEDANIVSYSGSTAVRNFTLAQTLYNYDYYNRSSTTDDNGEAALSTADADEDLQATLQHVVITYSAVNGRRIYVNGVYTDDQDPTAAGSVANWSDSFALVLGNEVSGNRPWQGQIRLLAIHNRALTEEQIQRNTAIQPGQKYFLIFNVDRWTNLMHSYVLFQVSQFDEYSYLFAEPRFIMLGDETNPGTVAIRGMRIGINGTVPRVGQVFGNVDTVVTSQNYPVEGFPISRLGTLISLGSGIDVDEFFLSFEQIGTGFNIFTDIGSLSEPTSNAEIDAPEVGFRLFDEIYATMAELTGIYSTGTGNADRYPDVIETYLNVRQQLPASTAADGFLGAHQAGVAQIAIEYCNALVDDTTLRNNFWSGASFPAPGSGTININSWLGSAAQRAAVVDPLVDRFMGTNLNSQPLTGDVTSPAPKGLPDNDSNPDTIKPGMTIKGELNSLILDLSACGSSCSEDRVDIIVKATCSATLGNAGIMMQ